MTALTALAAAAIAPPEDSAIPPALEPVIREACAGAWRAIEVVLAGDVLRGRLSKTRDVIVRDAVAAILELHKGSVRADALAALRSAREAGALDGAIDVAAVIADVRLQGPVAVGRAAVTVIRKQLAAYRALEQALADAELGALLVDTARAIVRTHARDPELARWAIGPTGSPARDRALSAFAELATSPESIAELEELISLPIHLDDNVQFTVYRPRAIDPGRWHQLLAFAHLAERRPGEDDLPDPVEEVQRQAAAALGNKAKNYQPVVQDSGAAIPEEGELTFVPEFPGIEVNPPRRSFLWLEQVHREEFRIRAGRQLDGQTVRGRVTVFLGHIAIAEVACAIRVDASRPEPKREPASVRAYRKIFASYSHRDLEIVNQFESYARALGDEYLRDWVHLRTGEVWTDRLCQLIDQADAFQLFWSRNSMHSQFVRQEYEYALSLNRASFVRPTYWEDPMPTAPGLPPEALLRLHFQKLGAAQLGAAARVDDEPKLIARKKRAPEAKREAPDTLDMERESSDTSAWSPSTDHFAAPAELDVTDPQYSMPEMPAASESLSSIAPPPEPVEAPALLKRSEARSITTEPGIGTVKPGTAMPKPAPAPPGMPPSMPKAFPITKPGVAEPRPAPMAAAPSPIAPAQPAGLPPAAPRPAPGPIPTTSLGVPPPPAINPASALGPPAAPSPWSRPSPMKTVMAASASTPVSPYGPTMPQPAYQPKADESISYKESAPTAIVSAPPPAITTEKPPARSIVPLLLVAIGILALVAVLLIWLL